MLVKKRVLFILTLCLIAFIALGGSRSWAESWEVKVNDGLEFVSPYGQRTLTLIGHDVSGPLTFGDVYVEPYVNDTWVTPSTFPLAPYLLPLQSVSYDPVTREVQASLVLTYDSFFVDPFYYTYYPGYSDESLISYFIIWLGVDSFSSSQPIYTDYFHPDAVIDEFYPLNPNGQGRTTVYNFFNCSVNNQHYSDFTDQNESDPVRLGFDRGATTIMPYGAFPSAGQTELKLDFKAYLEGNIIDDNENSYSLNIQDRAGNLVRDNNLNPGPRSISRLLAKKYVAGQENAITAYDGNNYMIKFPANFLVSNGLAGYFVNWFIPGWGITNFIVDGETLNGPSRIIQDGSYDVLIIAGQDATALGLTPENWTGKKKMTVAHVAGTTVPYYDYAFGVNDGVGPLLVSVISHPDSSDPEYGTTTLTFSEDLRNTGNFDLLRDLEINTMLNLTGATLNFTNSTTLTIDRVLNNYDFVNVNLSSNQGIMDIEGNLAQGNGIHTMTARRILRAAVTDLVNSLYFGDYTVIEIIFNDTLADTNIGNVNSYWVELVPGLVAKTGNPADGAQILNASFVNTITDKKVVQLYVQGMIQNTDAARLPRVMVQQNSLFGDTGAPIDNAGLMFNPEDQVGPYILEATIDENGFGTVIQGKVSPRTNTKIAVRFSEPVDLDLFKAAPDTALRLLPDTLPPDYILYGQGAEINYAANDADVVEIHLGTIATSIIPQLPSRIQIQDVRKVTDLLGLKAPDFAAQLPKRLLDRTIPYITKVTTEAGTGADQGKIVSLLIEFNNDFPARPWPFSPTLVSFGVSIPDDLQAFVDGKAIQLYDIFGNPVNANFNWLVPGPNAGKNLRLWLNGAVIPDTGAKPTLTLDFDPNNYLQDTQGWNRETQPITVLGANVVDGAKPHLETVEYQLIDNTNPNNVQYLITATFSELLDPNIWTDPITGNSFGRPEAILSMIPGGAYTITPGSFDPYNMDIHAPNKKVVFTITTSSEIASVTQAPFISSLAGQVKDQVGLVANNDQSQAGPFIPAPNVWAPSALYPPKFTTNVTMEVFGKVEDTNGNTYRPNTLGDLVVAAYTSDDLFLYTQGTTTTNDLSTLSASNGDIIVTMAPNTTCLGSTEVQTNGYYYLEVYGKDDIQAHSSAFAEGMTVHLVVIDTTTGQKYLATGGCPEDNDDYYLKFENSRNGGPDGLGGLREQNIYLQKQERITLHKGWNLVSTSVKKLYKQQGAAPSKVLSDSTNNAVNMPAVNMVSIKEVFASIDKQWSKVMSFDAVAQMALIGFSGDTIPQYPFFTVGYGAWIFVPKVKEATLVVFGDVIDSTENDAQEYQMPLVNGWNLVGHWGGHVKFADIVPIKGVNPNDPPGTDYVFSSAREDFVRVPEIVDVFGSISSLDRARGYNPKDGGMLVWYAQSPVPTIDFNLDYAGPGFGWWIKVTSENQALRWDAL